MNVWYDCMHRRRSRIFANPLIAPPVLLERRWVTMCKRRLLLTQRKTRAGGEGVGQVEVVQTGMVTSARKRTKG